MTDVERVRELEKDHKPDGFPAVEMALLTRLADRVESLESFVRMFDPDRTNATTAMAVAIRTVKERDALKAQLDNAINAYDGCAVERDDMRVKLARAKEFAWKREYDFDRDEFDISWTREVEEGGA